MTDDEKRDRACPEVMICLEVTTMASGRNMIEQQTCLLPGEYTFVDKASFDQARQECGELADLYTNLRAEADLLAEALLQIELPTPIAPENDDIEFWVRRVILLRTTAHRAREKYLAFKNGGKA